jgi:hypothetical protein
MPGFAKTQAFQFTTASVLIGSQANQLSLNSAANSIGLTKNLQFMVETGFATLTQGVMNQEVASLVNKYGVKSSIEIYEMTAQNLSYGLGLNGALGTAITPFAADTGLATAVAAAATSAVVPGDVHLNFPAGGWGYLQQGRDDAVHIFQCSGAAVYSSPNTTITFTGFPVPTGMAFDTVIGNCGAINKIDANPVYANQYFAIRLLGITAMDKRPIAIHMPKCKITKGFSMAFDDKNFANLPFEFEPMVPVSTDPGYSTQFTNLFSVFTPN